MSTVRRILGLLAVLVSCNAEFGTQVTRTPLRLEMPMTSEAAVAEGWVRNGDCDPNLGIPHTWAMQGTSPEHPMINYYTEGGQLAGQGVTYFAIEGESYVFSQWIDYAFVKEIEASFSYLATFSFRTPDQMCSGQTYPEAIGTEVVVNQGVDGGEYTIPSHVNDAIEAGMHKGSCMSGHGTSYFREFENGKGVDLGLSYVTGNLFPVLFLYDETGDGGLIGYENIAPGGQKMRSDMGDFQAGAPNNGDASQRFWWSFDYPVSSYAHTVPAVWSYPDADSDLTVTQTSICDFLCEPCWWPDTPQLYWNLQRILLRDGSDLDALQCEGTSTPQGTFCPDQESPDRIYNDLGYQVESLSFLYQDKPLDVSQAQDMGWYQISEECDAALGYTWARDQDGPTERWPLTMYFNEMGKIAGMGMTYYDIPGRSFVSQALVDAGIFTKTGDNSYIMILSFYEPTHMCARIMPSVYQFAPPGSLELPNWVLGYQMVINQDTIAHRLPQSRNIAKADGWLQGSCTNGMGEHFFKDITRNDGTLSYQWEPLMPLSLIYDQIGDVSYQGKGGLISWFFGSPGGQGANGNTGFHDIRQSGYTITNRPGKVPPIPEIVVAPEFGGWDWQWPWRSLQVNVTTPPVFPAILPEINLPSVCGNICDNTCDFWDIPASLPTSGRPSGNQWWTVAHQYFYDPGLITCQGDLHPGGVARCQPGLYDLDKSKVIGRDGAGNYRTVTKTTDVFGASVAADLAQCAAETSLLVDDLDCETSNECAGVGWCSPNAKKCMAFRPSGSYCNGIQLCHPQSRCEDHRCV